VLAVACAGGVLGGMHAALRGVAKPHLHIAAFTANSGILGLVALSTHHALSRVVTDRPRTVAFVAGATSGGLVAGLVFGWRSGLRGAATCGVIGLLFNEVAEYMSTL